MGEGGAGWFINPSINSLVTLTAKLLNFCPPVVVLVSLCVREEVKLRLLRNWSGCHSSEELGFKLGSV